MLPTFQSWTVLKMIECLTQGLLSSHSNIYHSTTAYFFEPPCILMLQRQPQACYKPTSRLCLISNYLLIHSCPAASQCGRTHVTSQSSIKREGQRMTVTIISYYSLVVISKVVYEIRYYCFIM